jgi:hypothetical protein
MESKTTFYNFLQRSEEWDAIRVTKVGGSEAIGLTTPARMETLLSLKTSENVTGRQESFFTSAAMQEGIDDEPVAQAEYEANEFCEVDAVGYVTNSDYKYLGLSPDGLMISLKRGLEIKCPQPKDHIIAILTNSVPKVYKFQVAMYFLMVPELETVDYVSYNRHCKANKYFKVTITRKEYLMDILKLKTEYAKYEVKYKANVSLLNQHAQGK